MDRRGLYKQINKIMQNEINAREIIEGDNINGKK